MSDELGGWADDPLHHHGTPDGSGPAGGNPYDDGWHDLSGGYDHGHPYHLAELDAADTDADGGTDSGPAHYGGHDAQPGALGHGPAGDGAGGDATDAAGHHTFDGGHADHTGAAGGGPAFGGGEHDGVPVDADDHGALGLAQPVDAHDFPPQLDLDVAPTDGLSWVDVDLLGDHAAVGGGVVVPDSPQALLADLHGQDSADGTPSWQAVSGSDDPAVRALAVFWQPR